MMGASQSPPDGDASGERVRCSLVNLPDAQADG